MNPLEEKVAKVKSLLDQRDSIDRELSILLGVEIEVAEDTTPLKGNSIFESKVACIRHYLKEDNDMSARDIVDKVREAGFPKTTSSDIYMAKKKMKQESEDREERGESEEDEPDMAISKDLISESKFEALKKLQDEDHTSLSAASEAHLHIGTVNKIFSCFSWDNFINTFPHLVENN